jgi:excisionase family DNA binding protein
MQAVEREWLTYKEATALVGLSRTKLWALISAGEVKAAKAGKAVRIHRGSLEKWMANHDYAEQLRLFD